MQNILCFNLRYLTISTTIQNHMVREIFFLDSTSPTHHSRTTTFKRINIAKPKERWSWFSRFTMAAGVIYSHKMLRRTFLSCPNSLWPFSWKILILNAAERYDKSVSSGNSRICCLLMTHELYFFTNIFLIFLTKLRCGEIFLFITKSRFWRIANGNRLSGKRRNDGNIFQTKKTFQLN